MAKTKSIFITLFISIIMLTSFLLVGCGDNTITNVTALNGIVDSIETSVTGDTLYSITIVYTDEPKSLKSVYGESELEVEPTIIEDYYNDSSNITAYSYTYSLGNITVEEYNLSPITITSTFGSSTYRFNLTTDLIEQIYPELLPDTAE